MKKIIIYISIMVSNCASLGAQSRELTATANLSKGSDSIHYDFITATVPQSSSVSDQTWDFSNSRYLGQEKEVFFVGNNSNRIKMIDKELKDKMRGISLESNTKHRPLPRIIFLRSRYLMPLATKPSQRSHITMA